VGGWWWDCGVYVGRLVGWCLELLDGTEESELDASFAKFLRT